MANFITENKNKKIDLTNLLDDFSTEINNNQSSIGEETGFLAFSSLKNTDDFCPLSLINNATVAEQASIINTEILPKANFNQEKEELIALHKQEIEQITINVRQEEAQKIKDYLREALLEIRTEVSNQVGNILSKFLGDKLKEQAVNAFVQKLKLSLLCNMSPIIVEGNQELLDLAAKYIGYDKSKFKFKATDANELSFKYDDKTLATNITSFLTELSGNNL